MPTYSRNSKKVSNTDLYFLSFASLKAMLSKSLSKNVDILIISSNVIVSTKLEKHNLVTFRYNVKGV